MVALTPGLHPPPRLPLSSSNQTRRQMPLKSTFRGGFKKQNNEGFLLKAGRECQTGHWQEIPSGECILWDAFGDQRAHRNMY